MIPIHAYPVLFWYTRKPITIGGHWICNNNRVMMQLELDKNIIYLN